MNIQDHTFVITGGARGLGLAIASSIADAGGRVALIDLDDAALEKAHSELTPHTDGHSWHNANVADETSVVNVFEAIQSTHGAIHGLVNNAGILRDGMLLKTQRDKPTEVTDSLSLAQWQAVIDVNFCLLYTSDAADEG